MDTDRRFLAAEFKDEAPQLPDSARPTLKDHTAVLAENLWTPFFRERD